MNIYVCVCVLYIMGPNLPLIYKNTATQSLAPIMGSCWTIGLRKEPRGVNFCIDKHPYIHFLLGHV